MADEVQEKVAEAVTAVAVEEARESAVAAADVAAEATGQAIAATAAAETVEAMADRAVENAALDAEQRIAKFAEEMDTCREEIAKLRLRVEEQTTSSRSISERLTRLAWLEEMMQKEKENLTEESAPSETSSATDGDTSAPDGGKKTDSENAAPEKTPAVKPEEAAEKKSTSEEQNDGSKAHGKAARHRWL